MATGIEGGLTADQTQEALIKLDLFDEEGVCWYFYINHYSVYDWAALDELYTPFNQNVQETVANIGWDEATWDSDETTEPIPESERQFWITLDPIIKWDYYSVGWNPMMLDNAKCDKLHIRISMCKVIISDVGLWYAFSMEADAS